MTSSIAVKSCSGCSRTKPETSFVSTRHGRRGSTCNECRNERRRARGESARRRAAETPEARRARQLWEMYRLTEEQYQALLAAQGGTCAICEDAPEADRPLAVDHCHTTGVVRALLCNRCNLVIGTYERAQQAAAKYLAKYGRGNPLLKPHSTV